MGKMQVDPSVTPLAMGTDHDPTNFDRITEADDDDDTVNHEAENGAKVEKEDGEEGAEELVLWHELARRSPHIIVVTRLP